MFAEDVPAAVRNESKKSDMKIAWCLKEVLLKVQSDLNPDGSDPKCRNFLGKRNGGSDLSAEATKRTKRRRMKQDLDQLLKGEGGVEEEEMPFKWRSGFELLAMRINCHRASEEYTKALR